MKEVKRMSVGKKWPRYFAILIALVMLAETIAFTLTGYAKNNTDTAYELTDSDKATVSEISNMTGVKAEKIAELRKEGRTWNQILELIKNDPDYRAEGDSARRNDTLAKAGIGEEALEKLKEEGFSEEEISAAKSLVERIMFQIEEITGMQAASPSLPDTGTYVNEKKEEDITAYTALGEKIDLSEAVYLILKLSDELGGAQGALDEYLCSLQLDIDLNRYLADKEGYLKQKQDKTVEMAAQDIITSARIEEKLLDMLQSMNKRDEDLPEIKTSIPSIPDAVKESPLPDVQAPDIEDIRPQNPAEAIMQEINEITADNGVQDRR
ncbi:MAG: hypothetical protein VB106_02625 [Clostridiaceae bacterium]|nr:hypothetical protein [Clostridiaceae bacterium]